VLGWLGSLPGPVAVTYEAGPTGFGLARFLAGQQIGCLVAAPSKLQRPSGDRVKTDVRDARHLARLLHLGEIVAVAVPTVEREAARDLVRAREDARKDLMSARHRVSKLLLRNGIVYYGGQPWTCRHDQWLRSQRFAQPSTQLAFDTAYDAMLGTVGRRDRLDAAITTMAAGSEYAPVVTRLGCLRGISTLTGFGLAVEVGDWGTALRAHDRRVPRFGALGELLRGVAVTRSDHEDRKRSRAAVVDRGGVASPQALPALGGDDAPVGAGIAGGAGARQVREPPSACAVGSVRRPQEAVGGSEHRNRPRARRVVLVAGGARLISP
jgi:hypothetical protein